MYVPPLEKEDVDRAIVVSTKACIGRRLVIGHLANRGMCGFDLSACVDLRRWPGSTFQPPSVRAVMLRARNMGYVTSPLRTALKTNSAAVWTSNFSMILMRCVSTVWMLRSSRLAISLLERPSANIW
jgi:hypothetical protein